MRRIAPNGRFPFSILVVAASLTLQAQSAPQPADGFEWPILPEAYEFRVDPEGLPEGTDPGLPESWRLALATVNEIRAESGLPALRYDPELTEMGKAHVEYVLLNARRGVATRGHYEDPSLPGYTELGDEAARTSGLSGGQTPLEGLRALLDAPFHRAQFLSGGSGRIGMGHGFDPSTGASMCLYVIRYDEEGSRPGRFVPYPAPESRSFGATFSREWPEPRPVRYAKDDPPVTGGIVSLGLSDADAKALVSCDAQLVDSSGRKVDMWVSSPAAPVPGKLPSDSGSVYRGDTEGTADAFALNFSQVHLMPKKPLEPGARYTAKVDLKIGKEQQRVEWSFSVAPRAAHRVEAGAEPYSPRSWEYARSIARPGDLIALSSGEHVLSGLAYFDRDAAIVGPGPERASVRYSKGEDDSTWLFARNCTLYVAGFSYSGDASLAFASSGAYVRIAEVWVSDLNSAAIYASDGGRVAIEGSSFERVGRSDAPPFHSFSSAKGKPKGAISLGVGNRFSELRSSSRAYLESESGRTWKVETGGELSLRDALLLVPTGETIELSGSHELRSGVFIETDLAIVGKGASISLFLEKNDAALKAYSGAKVSARGVAFSGDAHVGYATGGASVSFRDCSFSCGTGDFFVAMVDSKSSATLETCDLRAWASRWIILLRSADASYKAKGCVFAEGATPFVWRVDKAIPFQQAN
jgi:hypothetical protein